MGEDCTPFAFTSVKQKMGVKFTRKRLYISGVGVKVKGEGKKKHLDSSADVRARVVSPACGGVAKSGAF